MNMATGSLFTGLLKGFAQAQQLTQEREDKKAQRDLQKALFDLQSKKLASEQAKESRKNALSKVLEGYLPSFGQAGDTAPPSIPEIGAPATGSGSQSIESVLTNPAFMAWASLNDIDISPVAKMVQGREERAEQKGIMDLLKNQLSSGSGKNLLTDPLAVLMMEQAGMKPATASGLAQKQSEVKYIDVGNSMIGVLSNGQPTGQSIIKDPKNEWRSDQFGTYQLDRAGNPIAFYPAPSPTERISDVPSPDGGFGIALVPNQEFVRRQQEIQDSIAGQQQEPGLTQGIPPVQSNISEVPAGFPAGTTFLPTGEKPKPAESAGKIVSAQAASEDMTALVNGLVNAKGDIKRLNLLNFNLETPFTKGRTLADIWQGAVQAPIRLTTGASITDAEWPVFNQIFKPESLDDKEGVLRALYRLQRFNDYVLHALDPNKYPDKTKNKSAKDILSMFLIQEEKSKIPLSANSGKILSMLPKQDLNKEVENILGAP